MSTSGFDHHEIFDIINMGILIVDAQENIVMWNGWLERHSAIPAAIALGNNINHVFPTSPSAAFLAAVKNNITYGLPAVLSNALHRSPLPLFTTDELYGEAITIHQSITITSIGGSMSGGIGGIGGNTSASASGRCCLIQITDSSTSIRREKMLRSHSEILKKDATTDSLTSLYNRRFFDEHYKMALGQAIRQKNPLSIFMIDIDYFKQYNDYYGHPAGDKVLIQVAGALKKQIARSSDMLARYGGEEFILILPNMTEENSRGFADKLISAVSRLEIPHLKSKVDKYISISIGLSTYDPNKHREVSALIDAADTALYKAKQQGRNRASFLALDTLISHRHQVQI